SNAALESQQACGKPSEPSAIVPLAQVLPPSKLTPLKRLAPSVFEKETRFCRFVGFRAMAGSDWLPPTWLTFEGVPTIKEPASSARRSSGSIASFSPRARADAAPEPMRTLPPRCRSRGIRKDIGRAPRRYLVE